jgi:hypothetical protein
VQSVSVIWGFALLNQTICAKDRVFDLLNQAI